MRAPLSDVRARTVTEAPQFSEEIASRVADRRKILRHAHFKVAVARAALDAAAARAGTVGPAAPRDRAWELDASKAALARAMDERQKAAAGVLAAILEREAENLRAIEAAAARRRADLMTRARCGPTAGHGRVKLPAVAGTLLEYPAFYLGGPEVRFGSVERASPWRWLYTALLINPDSDLDAAPAGTDDRGADQPDG